MTALARMDIDLLNFLCAAAEKHVAIPRIDESRAASLERLREAQLIQADSFDPFPWALETWRHEQNLKTTAPKHAEPEGPPSPAAVRSEGAALCSEDASAEHVAGIAEAAPSDRDIKEAFGTAREASGAAESTAAMRISDRASIAEPALASAPAARALPSGLEMAAEIERFCDDRNVAPSRFGKIVCNGRGSLITDLKRTAQPSEDSIRRLRAAIADPPAALFDCKPRRRMSSEERAMMRDRFAGSYVADEMWRANARKADAVRKGAHAAALKRIERGEPAGKAGSVQIKLAQIAIEDRLKEEARLADPIEQAKNILRRRYAPVISAETVDGPAGKFIVGRKIVDERELLAMAESIAA